MTAVAKAIAKRPNSGRPEEFGDEQPNQEVEQGVRSEGKPDNHR